MTTEFADDHPFARLLATKYDPEREAEAQAILADHPGIARLAWPGPDTDGKPHIRGATALHYAANDGRLGLMRDLIALGTDPDADGAHWYRSVLAWAANNARTAAVRLLLEAGARADGLDAVPAAAWGGSRRGAGREADYADCLAVLIGAGADMNDRRFRGGQTPLGFALEAGNTGAIDCLRGLGAAES